MEDRKEEEMMDEKELASEDVIPEERDGAQAGEEGCEASEAGGTEAAEEEELNKESEEPGDGEEPEDGDAASEADGKEQGSVEGEKEHLENVLNQAWSCRLPHET